VLGAFLQAFQDEDLVNQIAQRIADAHQQDGPQLPLPELRKDVYCHINGLSKFVCYTMIAHTTHSVVSNILAKTLTRLLADTDTAYLKLLNISFLLEMPREFPQTEIVSLFGELQRNRFSRELLRIIVARHMYLYEVPFDARQAVCSKLDIKLLPSVHDQARKRLLK
jgi:hypothetical protein